MVFATCHGPGEAKDSKLAHSEIREVFAWHSKGQWMKRIRRSQRPFEPTCPVCPLFALHGPARPLTYTEPDLPILLTPSAIIAGPDAPWPIAQQEHTGPSHSTAHLPPGVLAHLASSPGEASCPYIPSHRENRTHA